MFEYILDEHVGIQFAPYPSPPGSVLVTTWTYGGATAAVLPPEEVRELAEALKSMTDAPNGQAHTNERNES